MTNDPNRAAFDRIVNVLTEIATLRDDIAELKTEYLNRPNGALTPEQWSDMIAVARVAVMDDAAREKREAAERRRKELSDQLELGV